MENNLSIARIPPLAGGSHAVSGQWATNNDQGRCAMCANRGLVLGCAVLVLLTCFAAEAKDKSGIKTIVVKCDKGDSINEALEDKADELIIEIRGICQEDVVISRSDVTLRGVDPDATVVAQSEQAIRIDRASRVTLEDLTVRGSTGPGLSGIGIFVDTSTGVTVSNVKAEENRGGLRAFSSTLRIVDSDFCRNIYGLYIGSGSNLIIDGDELNISENFIGLILSNSTLRALWPPGPRVLANDNENSGVLLQVSASAFFNGPLEAKRNGVGILVLSGHLTAQDGSVDVTENEFGVVADQRDAVIGFFGITNISENHDTGLLAKDGGYILFDGFFDGTLTGNGTAVRVGGTGRVTLRGTNCQDNDLGVWVHGGTALIQDSTIQGNTSGDVDLSFGARVSFEGDNDVGTVTCDDTVLVEGDVICPATKSATVSPPQIERAPTDWLGSVDLMTPRILH